jgi:putative Mn2+ efflux pump MntP
MANSKSDKPLVRNTIIFCVITILAFHFGWTTQYFINLHNTFFLIVDFGLMALFAWQAKSAYAHADDPNKDWKRLFIVALTVASSLWAGGWAVGLNERVGL